VYRAAVKEHYQGKALPIAGDGEEGEARALDETPEGLGGAGLVSLDDDVALDGVPW